MSDRKRAVPAGTIFAACLRLGLTAFGGPAMVAYIRDLVVKRKGWVAAESFRFGAFVVVVGVRPC